MRLVHIISSLEQGGAQAVLYDLVWELQKKGYEQSVIYFHDGPYAKRFIDSDIPIYQIRGLLSPFDPVALYRLYAWIKYLRPDRIHTLLWAANWMGRIIAKRCAIPCIAALHNNYDQNGWLRILLDRWVSFSNQVIIAVSQEVKNSLLQHQQIACPVVVITNGIRLKYTNEQKISRASMGFARNHFVIGSVGRFHPIKRHPLLLDTFALLYARYSHVRLLLVGTGPEEKNLREYAKSLQIDTAVTWIINMPARHYYPIMNCFVLSSPKEGISIALLEAMSCAKIPLVTYYTRQHPVIEHMHNGIVVQTQNATTLSKEIAKLVQDQGLCTRLGNCARDTVRDMFALDTMIASYSQVFQKNY